VNGGAPGARRGGPAPIALDELASHAGEHLGWSAWHRVTQDQVNLFAEATGDRQWIHVDEERARSGPFGRTIAHGYLTLSLAPALLWEVLEVEGASLVVNYGLDRVRFPTPVPLPSRVRLGVELERVEPFGEGLQAALKGTFELEGSAKPCCVAQILFRYYA
jgi:acyl dehydratase